MAGYDDIVQPDATSDLRKELGLDDTSRDFFRGDVQRALYMSLGNVEKLLIELVKQSREKDAREEP